MSDPKDLSIEEVLASCRRDDGGGGESSEPAKASEPAPAAPSTKPAAAKKPGEMSVEEMLAAARGDGAGGDKPAPAAKPAASASKKKPGEMSVEEMLAAARGDGSKPAAAKEKAAPKKVPAKAAATAKPATAKREGPMDTSSILAAARKEGKPGPMTKAEAAAKGQPAKPKGKPKIEVAPMPAKPAYAQPVARAEQPEEDRRTFMASMISVFAGSALAVGFSSFGLTSLLWTLGLARFMFPNILTEPPTKFKVGFPGDFSPGQVEAKYKAQFGVWIVRYEYEGVPEIYALQSVCTHLGCTPNWLEGEQKFKCPCHGSGFYKDGVNFEGPAPRPLERFAIRLADDGQLEVDKSRKFFEEKGEWKDPASFVSV